jgi:6-phosphogluconolactonase
MQRYLNLAAAAVIVLFGMRYGVALGQTAGGGSETNSMLVYIGTGTGANDPQHGIFVMRFDPASGKMSDVKLAATSARSTFIFIHPNRKWLYAFNEMSDANGNKGGGVEAFEIDPASGSLKLINNQPSGGKGPCYVSVDPSGRVALVANYGSGALASLAIDQASGALSPPVSVIQHSGSSANKERQSGPHAHSLNADPSGKFAISCDLGTDRVDVYKLDAAPAKLTENDPPFATVAPGSGPRHLAFSKDQKFVYVANEVNNTVTVFAWDGSRGSLSEVQTIGTLPADYSGTDTVSEVQVSPSGRFVYAANRGSNTMAIFAADQSTGKLEPRGHVPCGGNWPRNFRIDPSGKFMLVTNERSGNVVEFRIDDATGALTPTGESVQIPTPMCAKFLEAK